MTRPAPFPTLLAVLCSLLVIAAVAMIVLGLPEQTPLQQRLLQLYSVPLSGALALGVVHLSQGREPRRATRWVLIASAVLTALGAAAMAFGLVSALDELVPAGQTLIWLALGGALVHLAVGRPRRGRTFELEPAEDPDDEAAGISSPA